MACIPLHRSNSHHHHPQTGSLHLLLQAHQPQQLLNVEEAGNTHAYHHRMGVTRQDLCSSASSGFFSGFFFSQPQAHVHVSHSSCHPPPCSDTSHLCQGFSLHSKGSRWYHCALVILKITYVPLPAVGVLAICSAGPVHIGILCLHHLRSPAVFGFCLRFLRILLYNHYLSFFLVITVVKESILKLIGTKKKKKNGVRQMGVATGDKMEGIISDLISAYLS